MGERMKTLKFAKEIAEQHPGEEFPANSKDFDVVACVELVELAGGAEEGCLPRAARLEEKDAEPAGQKVGVKAAEGLPQEGQRLVVQKIDDNLPSMQQSEPYSRLLLDESCCNMHTPHGTCEEIQFGQED